MINSVFLNVSDIQKIMNISRATAYQLTHQKGFPTIRVGNRILIPTELFYKWVEQSAARGV